MSPVGTEPGEKSYEDECRERIKTWHRELKELKARPDSSELLKALKVAIDAELAIAELKIKVRQADWAKTLTWGRLVLPVLTAVLGALIGAWLKRC